MALAFSYRLDVDRVFLMHWMAPESFVLLPVCVSYQTRLSWECVTADLRAWSVAEY